MIQVSKKDPRESVESLVRRFNRKVQQSGRMVDAKIMTHFEKPMSKPERRKRAIIRRARKLAFVPKPRKPFGDRSDRPDRSAAA